MVYKNNTKAVEHKPVEAVSDPRKCTISDKMKSMLIEQLAHEMYNHNLYKSFANFFGVRGLPRLEEYYQGRAAEENLHHKWISDYLNEVDAEFTYPNIPAIKEQPKELIDPFVLTVDKEIETTYYINIIVNQAAEEGDWQTFAWLNGDNEDRGRLVLEQVEEESLSRTVLDIASSDEPWRIKEHTILDFYSK